MMHRSSCVSCHFWQRSPSGFWVEFTTQNTYMDTVLTTMLCSMSVRSFLFFFSCNAAPHRAVRIYPRELDRVFLNVAPHLLVAISPRRLLLGSAISLRPLPGDRISHAIPRVFFILPSPCKQDLWRLIALPTWFVTAH